jgi:hypothetical protein
MVFLNYSVVSARVGVGTRTKAARFRPVFNPPLASENFGCLLVEIRPSQGRSQLFKIGRGGTLNVPISGELRLLVNDNITGDNEGLFLVQVKRK